MAQTDIKTVYTATGNVLSCNKHPIKFYAKDEDTAKMMAKIMNRAVKRYYKSKTTDHRDIKYGIN